MVIDNLCADIIDKLAQKALAKETEESKMEEDEDNL